MDNEIDLNHIKSFLPPFVLEKVIPKKDPGIFLKANISSLMNCDLKVEENP